MMTSRLGSNRALVDDRSQDFQIEKKMKKMKMNLRIDAPKLRVTDLYAQYNKIIKDNGWKHLLRAKMEIR